MDRTAKVTFVTLVGSVVNIILTVFKIFGDTCKLPWHNVT